MLPTNPGWPVNVEDLQAVVASHVPVFYFHPDERWEPAGLSTAVDLHALADQHVARSADTSPPQSSGSCSGAAWPSCAEDGADRHALHWLTLQVASRQQTRLRVGAGTGHLARAGRGVWAGPGGRSAGVRAADSEAAPAALHAPATRCSCTCWRATSSRSGVAGSQPLGFCPTVHDAHCVQPHAQHWVLCRSLSMLTSRRWWTQKGDARLWKSTT